MGLVEVRIDRRLAVLGCDDDQRALEFACALQRMDYVADGSVNIFDLLEKRRRRSACRIQIAAFHAAFDQLLSYADRLKVHAVDRWHGGGLSIVCSAVNLIENRIYLQSVVALDVIEAVGPGGQVGAGIADSRAGLPFRGSNTGQGYNIGINLRRVVVVDSSAGACN